MTTPTHKPTLPTPTPHRPTANTQARSAGKAKERMAAVAAEMPILGNMNEGQLRQLMEANPGRVNDKDERGLTPLCVAVDRIESLPLIMWLLDEKGAYMNDTSKFGSTPLHAARSLDILTALMDRGANPALPTEYGWTPLMSQSAYKRSRLWRASCKTRVSELLSTCRIAMAVQHFIGPATIETRLQPPPSSTSSSTLAATLTLT